jgi:succinate dehydrogenase assembly factor 1
MKPHSGIQKKVLQLYRNCFKKTRSKPIENQYKFKLFIKSEFQKYKYLERKEFVTIEYLVRKGEKQLELLSDSQVLDVNI